MTIQTSGPISLNDVQTEFGGSNPISLNEYYAGGSYVPSGTSGTNGAVPTGGTISLWNFYGTSNFVPWIGNYNYLAGTYPNAFRATSDSSKNVYLAGLQDSDPLYDGDPFISKLNSSGVVQWKKSISGSAYNEQIGTVAIGTDGSVYAGGWSEWNDPLSYSIAFMSKWNSSGVLQWVNKYYSSTTSYHYIGNTMDVDTSGNCYFGYYTFAFGQLTTILIKINSSGTYQWGKKIGTGAAVTSGPHIKVDSSGNVYISVYSATTVYGSQDIHLLKYNSSGTLQWKIALGTAYSDMPLGMDIDSSGNVYITGSSFTLSAAEGYGAYVNFGQLIKINTSGTLQWSRRMLPPTSAPGGTGLVYRYVSVDPSDGSIYVTGEENAGNTRYLLILKYNSTGTLQWARSVRHSTGNSISATGCNATPDLYVYGQSTQYAPGLVLHLPKDGSKTGTYVVSTTFYYGAYTYTAEQAGGMSSTTSSISEVSYYASNDLGGISDYTPNIVASFVVTNM